MQTEQTDHWNAVYDARALQELTWFEPEPTISLHCLAPHLAQGRAIIDIGAGRSHFAQHVLDPGYGPVTLLDLSNRAMDHQRDVLGHRATYIAADVTTWIPDQTYDIWHDRAVFHFLTTRETQRAYFQTLTRALANGGVAVIATFDENGPEKCSNLPVQRYSPETFATQAFDLSNGQLQPIASLRHVHHTPKGNQQSFQFTTLRRVA